jgi:hypothetical protein
MRRRSLLDQIYRLKVFTVVACFVSAGLVVGAVGDWLDARHAAHLFVAMVQSLADILVVAGGMGLAIEFFPDVTRWRRM